MPAVLDLEGGSDPAIELTDEPLETYQNDFPPDLLAQLANLPDGQEPQVQEPNEVVYLAVSEVRRLDDDNDYVPLTYTSSRSKANSLILNLFTKDYKDFLDQRISPDDWSNFNHVQNGNYEQEENVIEWEISPIGELSFTVLEGGDGETIKAYVERRILRGDSTFEPKPGEKRR